MNLGEINQKWIMGLGTIIVTFMIGVGTPAYNSIQSRMDTQQMDINEVKNRVWEQQRLYVTEERLSRRLSEILQIVDTKISGINELQKDTSNQLQILIKNNSDFQNEVRQVLMNIER